MNRNLRVGFEAHLLVCCRRVTGSNAASAIACGSCGVQHANGRAAGCNRGDGVSRSLVAVEYRQMHEKFELVDIYRSKKSRPLLAGSK